MCTVGYYWEEQFSLFFFLNTPAECVVQESSIIMLEGKSMKKAEKERCPAQCFCRKMMRVLCSSMVVDSDSVTVSST